MLSLIFSLILAANSFAGLWEVATGSGASFFYIIINDRDDVRVYDSSWYPSRVRLSKWEGSTLKVDFYPSDKLQMFILEADLASDSVKGTVRIPTANFTSENEVVLTRYSVFPYSEPWKILSDRKRNEKINLIDFLVQRAPLDSFENFSTFWENDFKSRYYYFLYPVMRARDKSDAASEKEKLQGLYESLLKNRERAVEMTLNLKGDDGFTTVLVPDLGQSSPLNVPVTSYKIPLPPGVKICCGLKTHDIENFQLVKVNLDELSQSIGEGD